MGRGVLRTRGGSCREGQGPATEPQPLLAPRAAPGLGKRLVLGQRSPGEGACLLLRAQVLGGGRGWGHTGSGLAPLAVPLPCRGAGARHRSPRHRLCQAGPWQAPVPPAQLRPRRWHRVQDPRAASPHPTPAPPCSPGQGPVPKPQAGAERGGKGHPSPQQDRVPPTLAATFPPPAPASGQDGDSRSAGQPGPPPHRPPTLPHSCTKNLRGVAPPC